MEANEMVVGGLFDNLLKSLIQWPDFKKADHAMLKQGVGLALDALKPTTNALGSMLIDAAKTALQGLIDTLKAAAPLVVGASPEAREEAIVGAGRKRSKKEVEDMITAEGGDPKTFAPWILLLLQFLPTAIELIRKLLNK